MTGQCSHANHVGATQEICRANGLSFKATSREGTSGIRGWDLFVREPQAGLSSVLAQRWEPLTNMIMNEDTL